MQLFDAHVHLSNAQLKAALPRILSCYTGIGLAKAVIVGTSPEDWPEVIELARQDARCLPAIGLHPWQVNSAPEDWRTQLIGHLENGVSVIGEIGLDQWLRGHDITRQQDAFSWQLSLATERNLPTSIHCLKAHQPLLQTLRQVPLPQRGFKLHAYNGPVETLAALLDLGAYFSFNAGQLKPMARRVLQLIRSVPDDRLLIETDAPDFLPPPELREFTLEHPELCHPGNIRAGYCAIAELRSCTLDELTNVVARNFDRYFLQS